MHSHSWSTKYLLCSLVLFSVTLLSAVGCAAPKGPTVDGHAGRLSMTTASAAAVRGADITRASTPKRRNTKFHIAAVNGSVEHTPVYFRSDTERPDPDDDVFGLSGVDYIAAFTETVKFSISVALHPVDLLMTPPWTQMESDGHQTRRAAPGDQKKHGSG